MSVKRRGGDGYKPRHLKAAEGLVRSSLSLIWAGWAHLGIIVINVISIFMVVIVIMVIIILGNAGLNIVGLDPLTQPLHRTVAVERIRPQGPDHQDDYCKNYDARDEDYDSDNDYDGTRFGVVDDDMMTKWSL